MFKDSDFDVLDAEQITTTGPSHVSTADQVSTARPEVSAATPSTPPTTTTVFDDEDVTMAMAQTLIKMKEVKAKEKGVEFRNVEEATRPVRSITTLQPLPKIDPKDKGKSVLVEEEPKKVKSRDQGLAQIESDAELAQRLHEEELAELDRAQIERQRQEEATNAALTEEFDEIQARIDADALFAAKLQQEERAGDLRMIYDPDEKNELWLNQLDWKLLRWKLYESCGVHTLFMDGTPIEINMLVEKKYPLIKELLEKMLNLQLEAKEESTMAFELIKFIKSLFEE
ncbi:hypothetical protein Tco_0267926 [Tanacetum coccineum]